jgi:predicted RNA binding protein YcfA (HicA-like mRNA interferase family)
MTNKIKILSGKEVVKLFEKYGAVVGRTSGSHVRLQINNGSEQIHVTVPMHKEIKKGTLHSIAKDFEKCFGKEAIMKEFYQV